MWESALIYLNSNCSKFNNNEYDEIIVASQHTTIHQRAG